MLCVPFAVKQVGLPMNAESRGENTPKGLRSTAQGCPARRVTLGYDAWKTTTLKGLHRRLRRCRTPSGFQCLSGILPRVALLRRATLGYAAKRFQRKKCRASRESPRFRIFTAKSSSQRVQN